MKCVRCLRDSVRKIADAPDGSGAWELYFCDECHFSWRNDEPDFVIDPEKRDKWAQLDHVESFDPPPFVQTYRTVKKNPITGI